MRVESLVPTIKFKCTLAWRIQLHQYEAFLSLLSLYVSIGSDGRTLLHFALSQYTAKSPNLQGHTNDEIKKFLMMHTRTCTTSIIKCPRRRVIREQRQRIAMAMMTAKIPAIFRG